MAFTSNDYSAKVYAPGYFLAENENCERKTRQADSTDQRVITTGSGGKYLPMGTVYPSDDANAEGILYEDTDVTYGDMPCSVVLLGTVYENRLPVTSVEYNAVTPETGDDPSEKGWYERSGSEGAYVYTLSTDTEADSDKTYYEKTEIHISSAAKSALESKGIRFVTEPAVVRP